MRQLAIVFASLASLAVGGCSGSAPSENGGGGEAQVGSSGGGGAAPRAYAPAATATATRVKPPKRTTGRHATATFAAGCFWCVEAIFEHIEGVDEAVSGFSGGKESEPTYEQVARGKTGHTEAVQVHFNPDVVDYETLVGVLLGSMDPTQVDGQGPDHGRQYRSAIFFHAADQKAAAERALAKERTKHKKPLAVELLPYAKFWPAGDYHQDYEAKHPDDGYILAVSIPRLERFKKKFPNLLRAH